MSDKSSELTTSQKVKAYGAIGTLTATAAAVALLNSQQAPENKQPTDQRQEPTKEVQIKKEIPVSDIVNKDEVETINATATNQQKGFFSLPDRTTVPQDQKQIINKENQSQYTVLPEAVLGSEPQNPNQQNIIAIVQDKKSNQNFYLIYNEDLKINYIQEKAKELGIKITPPEQKTAETVTPTQKQTASEQTNVIGDITDNIIEGAKVAENTLEHLIHKDEEKPSTIVVNNLQFNKDGEGKYKVYLRKVKTENGKQVVDDLVTETLTPETANKYTFDIKSPMRLAGLNPDGANQFGNVWIKANPKDHESKELKVIHVRNFEPISQKESLGIIEAKEDIKKYGVLYDDDQNYHYNGNADSGEVSLK